MFRLLLIGISIMLSGTLSMAQGESVGFIYTMDDREAHVSTVCWYALDAPDDEHCLTVPQIGAYAISPDGSRLAFRTSPDGQIQVIDFTTMEITSWGLCQPTQEFLWDDHYYTSDSLLWSPSGRYLAFTGVLTDSRCKVSEAGDIYIYTPETQELTNITGDAPHVRSLLVPAAWSPDEAWLTLYGGWSEYENDQGYTVPDWGSAVISRDGATFFEVAPSYNTCRLSWSSDMTWLASNTKCFESLGVGSGLLVIPFDFALTQGGLRMDEVISPLRFDWRDGSSWTSVYGTPLWLDADTLVVQRWIVPMGFGYLSNEQVAAYSTGGLVEIDLSTMSETMLPDRDFGERTQRLEDWFVIQDRDTRVITAFNPRLNREFVSPPGIHSCPIQYALKIDPQGDFIAVLDACESLTATPSIAIYDTHDFHLVQQIQPDESPSLSPLGFFRLPQ